MVDCGSTLAAGPSWSTISPILSSSYARAWRSAGIHTVRSAMADVDGRHTGGKAAKFATDEPIAAGKRKFAAAASNTPVDYAAFSKLNEEEKAYDEKRERVIKDSRDIQKAAKQAIYCLHRADLTGARAKLSAAEAAAQKLQPVVDAESSLRSGGSYSNAMEEWAEAVVFLKFLCEGRVARLEEMPAGTSRDEYLGGVLDFTGELNRYAVARATDRDVAAVQACRDVVDGLMGVFLEFDFRNGALRKKFDSLKYTLKKMEATLYEQSLTANLGFARHADGEAGQPDGAAAAANDHQ